MSRPDREPMRLTIVTGISGSGKSLAIRVLEDAGFYCIDNLPVAFLADVVDALEDEGHDKIARLGRCPDRQVDWPTCAASSASAACAATMSRCCSSTPGPTRWSSAIPRPAGAIR